MGLGRVRWRFLAFLGVLLLVGAACNGDDEQGGETAAESPAEAPEEVVSIRFQQSFVPTEQYIPEAVAIEQGFFEELGLEVDIEPGTGGAQSAQLVASGTSPIGVAGASDILVVQEQGAELLGVGVSIPRDPSSLISLSTNPIESVEDIPGKRIGIIPESTSFALLRAALENNGIDVEQDVEAVALGFGDLVSAVVGGDVDAIAAFETTNVPAIQAEGADPVVLRFAELGVDVPGNTYVVNPDFAEQEPDAVARFLLGVVRGFQFVQENGVEAGLDAVISLFPEVEEQQELLATRYGYSLENGFLPFGEGEAIELENLRFDQSTLETLNDALVAGELIGDPVDLDTVFTDEFIDRAEGLDS